jgi:hypothetical protein
MTPVGRDLGERREHEAPPVEARMGQRRIALAPDRAADVEQVDVDDARTVPRSPNSPESFLDTERESEEGLRRPPPAHACHEFEEEGLVGEPDRLGRVERRDALDPQCGAEAGERPAEVPAAISEVRAEAEVGDAAGARLRTPLPPPRGACARRAPRSRRGPRRRRLLLRRRGLPHRTRLRSLREPAP